MNVDEVQAAAVDYYTSLPYHRWAHVQAVVDVADTLLARCWQHGVAVDDAVVNAALYFHAAGYQWDHEAIGYDSKAAYSAAICADELEAFGVAAETIEVVTDCILATRPTATYETVAQALTRTADLHDLMADYRTFRDAATKLYAEHRRLADDPLPKQAWADRLEDTLTHYLDQDVRLTPAHDDSDGLGAWHARAERNLDRFQEEWAAEG